MMYDSNSSLNSVQSMQAQGFAQHQYGMHYNNSVWQQHQSNPGSGGFPQPQANSRGQEFSHQNGSAAQAMMAGLTVDIQRGYAGTSHKGIAFLDGIEESTAVNGTAGAKRTKQWV